MSLTTRRDNGIVVAVASNIAHANTAALALKVADTLPNRNRPPRPRAAGAMLSRCPSPRLTSQGLPKKARRMALTGRVGRGTARPS